MTTAYAWGFAILLFGLFTWLGVRFSKVSSTGDFLLMGRSVGFWLFFGAYTGAAIGGASVAGFTGYGWEQGYSSMWLIAVSGITVPAFAFFFAKKINVFGRKHGAYTLSDFLAKRFGEGIRIPTSLISYLRPVFISGLQFLALGLVFQVGFGINLKLGILLGAGVVLLYTITGGQLSAVTSQWFQSIIQGGGMLLFLYLVVHFNGGLSNSIHRMYSLLPQRMLSAWSTDLSVLSLWIISMGLFYLVDPWLFQWAYMARSAQTSFDALVAVSLSSPWGAISFLGGMLLSAGARAGIFPFPSGISGDQVYLYFISKIIPPLAGGFLLVAFLMTVMSCASSFLMTGATLLFNDIIEKSIKKPLSEGRKIFLSRVSVLITALLGVASALWIPFLIPLWIMGQALAIAGLLVPVGAAWFWRRATPKAAVYSLAGGASLAFIWSLLAWWGKGNPNGFLYGLHAVHVGLAASLLIMVVVSYFTPRASGEMERATLWKEIPWEEE